MALIKVGAATEVELKEKKHRIEDAVSATRAAIEEGIVPGGGVALIRAEEAIDVDALGLAGDEATGALIVRRRCRAGQADRRATPDSRAPSWSSASAAESDAMGFNAATGEWDDLMKAGIIDPAKVTRSALQNAASIAALVLTTEGAVVEMPEEEESGAGGHGHMH